MAIRVNPRLIEDLERYGAQDVVKCYHCGNCSATCPFSGEDYPFPRKCMRYLQMGLEEKLRGDLEPWLCYYCGECSEECPREAEPGETMMAMRRWLTSQYDFTGISRMFYRSWRTEAVAIVVVALLTAAGFLAWGFSHGSLDVYDGPGAFLASSAVHRFDWALGGVLAGLLLVNSGRMWWFSVGGDRKLRVPLASYLRQAWLVPLHFLTQKRYRECGRKRPWAVHLVLMASYLTLLVLIMFFLHAMQSGPEIVWGAHAFGYLATLGLIGTTIWAVRGRLLAREPHYRHSHESDWIFLGLLLFVATTGVVQHVLHRTGLGRAANVAYVVHLAGVVPMLALEVPFSKWAHLAYRPLAMYFAAIRQDAVRSREREETAAAARAA